MPVPQIKIDPMTVFSLTEIDGEGLETAVAKLDANTKEYHIGKEEFGPFDVYTITRVAGVPVYQVVRLGWMASCTCPDFAYSHKPCKHIGLCLPSVCVECRERPVSTLGQTCSHCLMDNAPYLSPTANSRPVEKVGRIRI